MPVKKLSRYVARNCPTQPPTNGTPQPADLATAYAKLAEQLAQLRRVNAACHQELPLDSGCLTYATEITQALFIAEAFAERIATKLEQEPQP